MKTLIWTLGRGGLLGSHLEPECGKNVQHAETWHCPIQSFDWTNEETAQEQVREAVQKFSGETCDHWVIVWAAGAGIIGSTKESLDQETRLLTTLLSSIEESSLKEKKGLFFLSSSAGALAPECTNGPATERTEPEPISDYGRQKVEQEGMLKEWTQNNTNTSVVIGRISNLYGAGQNLEKGQGLIGHMSRCVLQRKSLHMYVSFDTIRDYLFVEDAAKQIAECIDAVLMKSIDEGQQVLVKLFASEQPVTLAEVLSTFQRVAKQPLQIVQGVTKLTKEQRRHVYFKSVVEPKLHVPITPLPIGMAGMHAGHQKMLATGELQS